MDAIKMRIDITTGCVYRTICRKVATIYHHLWWFAGAFFPHNRWLTLRLILHVFWMIQAGWEWLVPVTNGEPWLGQ